MPEKQKLLSLFTLGDVPGMEIEFFSPELLRAMDGQRIRAETRGFERGRERGMERESERVGGLDRQCWSP